MFYVGQKVVCVDDGCVNEWLTKAGIYVVRWVGVYDFDEWPMYRGAPSIRVAQIIRPCGDAPFLSERFRPVVNTDISIFKRMLVNPPSVKEDA
jgi:hypothetical protein